MAQEGAPTGEPPPPSMADRFPFSSIRSVSPSWSEVSTMASTSPRSASVASDQLSGSWSALASPATFVRYIVALSGCSNSGGSSAAASFAFSSSRRAAFAFISARTSEGARPS